MKRRYFLCLTLLLLVLTLSYRPVFALLLDENNPTIWVHLASDKAPAEFQEMWLMWPLIKEVNNLEYLTLELYAPADSGWNGTAYTGYDAFKVDLSYFKLADDVIFRISATFQDQGNTTEARLLKLDDSIDAAWPGLGLKGNPFGFGFFNYDSEYTGGPVYIPGTIYQNTPEVALTQLYYSLTLLGSYIEEYLIDVSQKSQFVHAPVPEPMTLLLLGSGLAAFAGFRKRIIR